MEHLSLSKAWKRGFTAIELLVVVAILAILSAIIISSLSVFHKQSLLVTETQQVVTFLNNARLSSMSSKGDRQYGVHLQADKIVLFQGTTYTPGLSTNETYAFNTPISIGVIVVNGGGSDIVFQQITGETSQNATTTLVVAGSTASSTIVVRGTGVVTVN